MFTHGRIRSSFRRPVYFEQQTVHVRRLESVGGRRSGFKRATAVPMDTKVGHRTHHEPARCGGANRLESGEDLGASNHGRLRFKADENDLERESVERFGFLPQRVRETRG